MKRFANFYPYIITILVICCIFLNVFCFYTISPVTSIILVRHADRAGSADSLNTLGNVRALELDRVLHEAGITAIYASNYNRTQDTADDLASSLGISLEIYNASEIPALVTDINANHKGEVILVVGHSNTVPETIGLLGISPQPLDIDHDEYDHMYHVTLSDHTVPRLIKMKYGAVTD